MKNRVVDKNNNYCHQKHSDNLQQFYNAAEGAWSDANLFQD